VDENGEHPAPLSNVSAEDVRTGKWRFNPTIASQFGISAEAGQERLKYYTATLEEGANMRWTIWPYHAMAWRVGHALVSSVEEALFFHSIARSSRHILRSKVTVSFTGALNSVIGPEVERGPKGEMLGEHNNSSRNA